MRPAIDREPFDKLLQRLGEVFGKSVQPSLVSTYWEALKHHDLSAIEQRAKSHIAHGKHFPRPVEITPEQQPKAAPAQQEKPSPEYDVLHRHAQQVLLSFLRHKQIGASHASLVRMLAAKNKLVADFRWICQDEPTAASELRDKLLAAFEQAYEPMPQRELDEQIGHFQRTGRVLDKFRVSRETNAQEYSHAS